MAPREVPRRLIVNADDFGRSPSINAAVIQAHQQGILTTASLMVNGEAAAEAVALARQNPQLGVGLHLTLICGTAALRPDEIPGLLDGQSRFSDDPASTSFRYFARRTLRSQLCAEIRAQLARFRQTGLKLDHLNGHLHLHLHPTIFRILVALASEWGITHMRLTRDPLWLNLRLDSGRWFYRVAHAFLFAALSRHVRPTFARLNLRHTAVVFGLLQNAHVDEPFVAGLLARLPPGDSELYSHPSLDEFRNEFDALVSPRVKALVGQRGIQLIRYQDL